VTLRRTLAAVFLAAAVPGGLAACGDGGGGDGDDDVLEPPMGIGDGPVLVDLSAPPPRQLSHMRLLEWDAAAETIRYNDRVVPYDLNTPLFSDYALTARATYIPDGEAATYDAEGVMAFPVGTVIVKTFYFADDFRTPGEDLRLIETRVLRHGEDGWEAWPYLWNDEQTEATLAVGGATMTIDFVDAQGQLQTSSYLVPQRNQCLSCHERNVGPGGSTVLTPIGPAARHLNRDYPYEGGVENQLTHLDAMGMLDGLPPMDDVPAAYDFAPIAAGGPDAIPDADVERAARDYLDINCAHCHDPNGAQGVTSQLFLNHDNEDAFRLGVCKRPGSAGEGTGGLFYNIVPGNPDESILVFRTETLEIGAMMPLLGRSLRDAHGAALVRRWVADMPPMDCE